MEKTIFEKIIDGEIPSYKIYEDEHVYSFLDVFPITKGHTLVIPKKHSRNIFDCDPETAANIGRVLPKIANAVKEAYGCDGVNIFQNNEEYAGQSVFHLHFHIVPRYKDKDVNFDNLEVKWQDSDFEEVKHIFSHRMWHVRIIAGQVVDSKEYSDKEVVWLTPEEFDLYPLAKPQQKIWQEYSKRCWQH